MKKEIKNCSRCLYPVKICHDYCPICDEEKEKRQSFREMMED